jgi:hypothetical protein
MERGLELTRTLDYEDVLGVVMGIIVDFIMDIPQNALDTMLVSSAPFTLLAIVTQVWAKACVEGGSHKGTEMMREFMEDTMADMAI